MLMCEILSSKIHKCDVIFICRTKKSQFVYVFFTYSCLFLKAAWIVFTGEPGARFARAPSNNNEASLVILKQVSHMKLDVISVVVLVFCFGVCVTLAVEAKSVFGEDKAEVVVAESH